MMFPIHDDLTERFKSFVDDDGLSEGDRLQVTLYDGRIIRFRLEAIFENEGAYELWRSGRDNPPPAQTREEAATIVQDLKRRSGIMDAEEVGTAVVNNLRERGLMNE